MADPSYTKFYFIPKEKVANLLGLNSKYEEGSIICTYDGYVDMRLSNYTIPQQIVSSPQMRAYVGMIGTILEMTERAGISGRFERAKNSWMKSSRNTRYKGAIRCRHKRNSISFQKSE